MIEENRVRGELGDRFKLRPVAANSEEAIQVLVQFEKSA